MRTLWLDLETYSRADLKQVGAWRYANEPSTEVICVCAAWNDDVPMPVDLFDLEGMVEQADRVAAHNAAFERNILTYVLGIHTPAEVWIDTAAYAAACGLPRKLATLCKVLGLPREDSKDKRGTRLINLLCSPGKDDKRLRDAALEAEFIEYCRQDVHAMRECWRKLPDTTLTCAEQQIMAVDMRINERGVRVDRELAIAAASQYANLVANADGALARVTAGAVTSVSEVAKLREFLAAQGCDLPDLRATTVEEALALPQDDVVTECLQLRQVGSKTGGAKFSRYIELSDIDARAHDLHMYHAAHTGRWGGRMLQPQNMPRPTLKDTDAAAQAVKDGDVEWLYDTPMAVLNSVVRSCIVPSPGNVLLVGDYSAIEARIVPWLAGQQNILDAFSRGEDIYKVAASGIFRVPVDEVAKDQRMVGKVAVLALGFGGGVGAFESMAKQYRVSVPSNVEQIVQAWRKANSKIVAFWYDIDRAFRTLLNANHDGSTLRVGKVVLSRSGKTIRMRLPNGYTLRYHSPRVGEDDQLRYLGVHSKTYNWSVLYTWGGRLCIAGDTQLLTAGGWKRLDEYVPGDLLWDGEQWCTGGKLLDQGVGFVIQLNGVDMTPDHEVLTDDGWFPARTLAQEARPWTTVSIPDCSPLLAHREWQDALVGAMHGVQSRSDESLERNHTRQSRNRDVRLSSQDSHQREETNTRNVAASWVSRVGKHEGSLSSTYTSSVAQLRRARDRCVRAMADFREFLVGHGPNIRTWSLARSHRQQRELHAGELSMDYGYRTEPQSARQSPPTDSVGIHHGGGGFGSHRHRSNDAVLAYQEQVADRKIAHVYDIENVGPRQRFVVRADEHHEPMIVHNCQNITEAVGRCLLGEALVRMEQAKLNPVLHVHDEALCDAPAERLAEFQQCLEHVPEWATGLPIASECHALQRYRKM